MGLPSKASFKTTAFGVSARELIIIGGGLLLGLAILAVPFTSIFIRIVLAAGIA